MEFGLRLGQNPQVVITTTPKPTKLIKALASSPETYVTRGSTYDNKPNLARNFYEKIIGKYEGTRLGRQELMAELLDDRPGALWTLQAIDADRAVQCPALTRVVVGTRSRRHEQRRLGGMGDSGCRYGTESRWPDVAAPLLCDRRSQRQVQPERCGEAGGSRLHGSTMRIASSPKSITAAI